MSPVSKALALAGAPGLVRLLCVLVIGLVAAPAWAQPIVATPSAVTFTWIVGQPLPPSQIVNVGAGTTTWTTQDTNLWADATGGFWANGVSTYPANAQDFRLQPSNGMLVLKPGTYTERVTVTRGGSTVTVPVTATVLASGPSSTRTLEYREPTVNTDGSALADLDSMRLYWSLNGGPERMETFPASGPTGGAQRTQTFTVPAAQGTITGALVAVDRAGNEGARVASAPLVFGGGGGAPAKGTITTIRVTQ